MCPIATLFLRKEVKGRLPVQHHTDPYKCTQGLRPTSHTHRRIDDAFSQDATNSLYLSLKR